MNNETNLNPLPVCSSQQLELKNASLRAGDQLKVKLFILHDAERCAIQTHFFMLSIKDSILATRRSGLFKSTRLLYTYGFN